MHHRAAHAIVILLAAAALSGCVRRFVSAPFGTPLDEVCNPTNGNLSAPLDTVRLGPAELPITKGWTSSQVTPQELQLQRIDAELNVWRGPRFIFPAVPPQNAVRCTIPRGDTTITLQAVRLNGFNYRVDVSWEPLINGQYFYMQLQTRYVEHLRSMRGMVEAVRFPVDSAKVSR
jgi:hypothetical protein